MRPRKLLTLLVGSFLLFSTNFKEISNGQRIVAERQHLIQDVIRFANDSSDDSDTEDPSIIFQRAIDNYKDQFSEYLNITGLNVEDKEAISLPNFDINYIAPSYADVMFDYQSKLENSLTSLQFEKYDSLRKQSIDFDRYVTLNNNKYLNLEIEPKYTHSPFENKFNPSFPNNPFLPGTGITPPPTINPPTVGKSVSATAVVEGIVAILSSAGLSNAVISAFTGCVSTLSGALSASWIPFVGWAIAVALATGALIALTVIIVQNWDAISLKINEIKAWFLEQFSLFGSLINSFFSDATAKGEESTISQKVLIGEKTFEFKEVKSDDTAELVAIANLARRNYDVFLMQYVKLGSFQIAIGFPTTTDFCIKFKTHLNGFNSYTWYQNNARNLIIKAGTGYTSTKPDLHLLNKNSLGNHQPKFAFKHFHNYTAAGVRDENNPQHRSHSFFGLLWYTPNDDGAGEIYPGGPQN